MARFAFSHPAVSVAHWLLRTFVNALRYLIIILALWILYLVFRNYYSTEQSSLTGSEESMLHPKFVPQMRPKDAERLFYCDENCGENVKRMERIMENESLQYDEAMRYLGLNGDNISYTNIDDLLLSDIVFVTAFTNSYLRKARRSCSSFSSSNQFKNFGKIRLIAFDLGGSSDSDLKSYAQDCKHVEVRKFPFDKFPKYVGAAMQYRFKAIAIALALKEAKAAFWMDTSIVFNNEGNGTLQFHFEEMKKDGRPVTLFFFSSHSIAAATHPSAYKYLTIDNTTAHERRMYDANSQLWFGTREAKQKILRRYVQCSLIENCMAPPGAGVYCSFRPDRKYYAGCHRFDQSTVNIILNLYTNDSMASYVRDLAQWVPNRDPA